jgi:3-deoxy-manno-octulosonate cytidylyltransferase (CMP-KDO synthetase)
MSVIVAIPARLESSRFPGKILADINGHPMLWHVLQGVAKATKVDDVWVLTDSSDVQSAVLSWGAKALMTQPDCPSGTARIASVIGQLQAETIINVQGDEPLISGQVIDLVAEALENSDADVATPVFQITETEDIFNANLVKVVRDAKGMALYFSRSAIPHVRDMEPNNWLTAASFWGHVGVYAYQRNVLEDLHQLPEGELEGAEKLEQLRLIEAGLTIQTVVVKYKSRGVDTPGDLEQVKKFLLGTF